MKIVLVMPTLSCGGAERVGAAMANYWIEQGNEVTLITLDDPQSKPFYELSTKVHYIQLGLFNESKNIAEGLKNNFSRVKSLHTLFKKQEADVIISIIGRSNIRVLFAAVILKTPIIVFEQIDPARDSLSCLWRVLRLLAYARANRIIVLTQEFAKYFPSFLRGRIRVIPNPVVLTDLSAEKSLSGRDMLKIIAVGRLELQKGFDYLLQALTGLKDASQKWDLTILGEGSQRQSLELLCTQLGLVDQVYFAGKVKDVAAFLQQSDLFILSSRVEGFPLALCEALACGVPVIATDCAASIREIVRDRIDGVIVPNEDVPALTKAISDLMSDPERRERMAYQASSIVGKLNLPLIMAKWDELLNELVV